MPIASHSLTNVSHLSLEISSSYKLKIIIILNFKNLLFKVEFQLKRSILFLTDVIFYHENSFWLRNVIFDWKCHFLPLTVFFDTKISFSTPKYHFWHQNVIFDTKMSFFYTKMSFLTPICHFRRLNVIFHHLLFFITKVQYLPLNVILATLIFCAAHSGYPVVKFCQDFLPQYCINDRKDSEDTFGYTRER